MGPGPAAEFAAPTLCSASTQYTLHDSVCLFIIPLDCPPGDQRSHSFYHTPETENVWSLEEGRKGHSNEKHRPASLLCTRHLAKFITSSNSFHGYCNLREVEPFVQGHTARKWSLWEFEPGPTDLQSTCSLPWLGPPCHGGQDMPSLEAHLVAIREACSDESLRGAFPPGAAGETGRARG